MEEYNAAQDQNADLYSEKIERFIGFEGNDSNEGILQFSINVPKKSDKRIAAKNKELIRFRDEWLIKDVALDFRILRKKAAWYGILTQLLDRFEIYYDVPAYLDRRHPHEKQALHFRGENQTINPAMLIGISSPPLLRWFSNLCEHLMSEDLSGKNITLNSTIGNDELKDIPPLASLAQQQYHNKEKIIKERSLSKQHSEFYNWGLDHLLRNTINGLASDFATNHSMSFAPYKASYKKNRLPNFSQTNTLGTNTLDKIVEEHNKIIASRDAKKGKYQLGFVPDSAAPITPPSQPNLYADAPVNFSPSPTIDEIEKATMYDAIFGRTIDGTPTETPIIPIDVLLETESSMNRMHEKESDSEEGWEELARTFLPLHGLDPENYGLKTPEQKEETVPETPSGEMPKTPDSSYEEMSVHEHQHTPIDASDIADATEAAIIRLEEERNDDDNLSGGEFLITPAQFVADILTEAAPAIITPYNQTPPLHLEEVTHPSAGMSDEHPDEANTPSTPALRLPSISEVLPAIEPLELTPSTARVHQNPHHCSKIAEKFIEAWRHAKQKLYRRFGIRHFNINRALFQSGAVCHRCYQLVRRHHEMYHLKSGRTVDHVVSKYPRSRTKKQKKEIKTDKHSRIYKETRKQAKKYTKKLVKKNASQLRLYNKRLK